MTREEKLTRANLKAQAFAEALVKFLAYPKPNNQKFGMIAAWNARVSAAYALAAWEDRPVRLALDPNAEDDLEKEMAPF